MKNEITIIRNVFTDKSTIGELFIDGEFFCATLENPIGDPKTRKTTAIAPGRYRIIRTHSPTFSPKRKSMDDGEMLIPRLVDVPGRDGILFHWGNKPEDTEGCILVGIYLEQKKDWISSSIDTFKKFDKKLEEMLKENDLAYVTIVGGTKADEVKP